MNFALRCLKRTVFTIAGAAAICAIGASWANAQSFNAWNSNQARLISGYTFNIDGVAQSDLSNVGLSGTIDFGFAAPDVPIVVQFLAGSAAFGVAPGGYMSF